MTNIRENNLNGYVDWVNTIDWTWFCTFTTSYELTQNSARRLMERFHSWMQVYTGNQCQFFWVTEKNELRDGCHTHGLLKVPEEFTAQHHYANIIDQYQVLTGSKIIKNNGGKPEFDRKWCRVDLQKFDKRRNAGKYCLKYISKSQKGGKGDFDFLL